MAYVLLYDGFDNDWCVVYGPAHPDLCKQEYDRLTKRMEEEGNTIDRYRIADREEAYHLCRGDLTDYGKLCKEG